MERWIDSKFCAPTNILLLDLCKRSDAPTHVRRNAGLLRSEKNVATMNGIYTVLRYAHGTLYHSENK